MIEIDGSFGEGGGQVIRSSLTLSAITKKPVRIFNIRAGRPNPGLQMQHLTSAKAVRNICRGTLIGAELHSTELIFEPGEIIGGEYEFNIGTAGATTLVAQTLLPIALFGNKKSNFLIHGGTHVMKSPGYDYFKNVFIPAISKFGVKAASELVKTGYYPKGGGLIKVSLDQAKLSGNIDWNCPNEDTRTLIRIANLPLTIAVREKKIFIQNNLEKIFLREDESLSPGNSILIWTGFRGAYALGEKGKRAEAVAEEALSEFKKEDGEVDKHLADQLLIYASLADGPTRYKTSEITEHLKTNVYVMGRFLDRKIEIKNNEVRVL